MKKEKEIKKVCIKCFKEIDDESNFYSFTEWNKEKVVSVNYAHRLCWDTFLQQLGSMEQAQKMLRGLEGPLKTMGFLKDKPMEVTIP